MKFIDILKIQNKTDLFITELTNMSKNTSNDNLISYEIELCTHFEDIKDPQINKIYYYTTADKVSCYFFSQSSHSKEADFRSLEFRKYLFGDSCLKNSELFANKLMFCARESFPSFQLFTRNMLLNRFCEELTLIKNQFILDLGTELNAGSEGLIAKFIIDIQRLYNNKAYHAAISSAYSELPPYEFIELKDSTETLSPPIKPVIEEQSKTLYSKHYISSIPAKHPAKSSWENLIFYCNYVMIQFKNIIKNTQDSYRSFRFYVSDKKGLKKNIEEADSLIDNITTPSSYK